MRLMEKRYPLGSAAIVLAQGDLTREAVDAVVNAANAGLLGGGGVDGALHRAAGLELLAACREAKKTLPGGLLAVGQAVVTPGFQLAARHVIHTVGPIYGENQGRDAALLASCHRRSLALARELGLGSIAFPAISTGVYGYPMRAAAEVALATVREELAAHGAPALVRFVLFGTAAFTTFAEVAEARLRS
jgi:O-acetyl-ADP-ribose deacetylase (regulator of RNase III)